MHYRRNDPLQHLPMEVEHQGQLSDLIPAPVSVKGLQKKAPSLSVYCLASHIYVCICVCMYVLCMYVCFMK